MVASRIVCPATKLATTRLWHTSTLAQEFGVADATEQHLEKIKARVEAGKLLEQGKIGVAVGKVVNQYKVTKHFELLIADGSFTYTRKMDSIAAEAALDGLYIIRTAVTAERMDAPTCVRTYKSLAQVERAFRSIKTMDLKVRPIRHHRECRVRDPVAPAQRSVAAMKKVLTRILEDGSPVHSFQTLMAQLQAIVRNTCRTQGDALEAPTFEVITTPSDEQKRALELIGQIKM